jgi:membrane-anchored protein YejM (alkaline phosphatase superfamily)
MQVWAHSVLPQPISKLFIQNEVAEGLAKGKLFASTKEIRAHEMFLDFLAEEKDLPDHSRYTFIHIYPTHSPYVFEPDCSYTIVGGEVSRSSREAGYKCALQLISRFVKTLKRINRYENALIVIQADHGRVVAIKDGKLLQITGDGKETKNQLFLAHAKALLLIKSPGKNGKDNFEVSQSETMLVDLFPTMMSMLDIKTNLELDGISLEGNETIKSRLRRFFNDEGEELLLQNGIVID